MNKGYTLIELIICVSIIFIIPVVGSLIYIIGHFICKFW